MEKNTNTSNFDRYHLVKFLKAGLRKFGFESKTQVKALFLKIKTAVKFNLGVTSETLNHPHKRRGQVASVGNVRIQLKNDAF